MGQLAQDTQTKARAKRVKASLPVQFESGTSGVTQDISVSGMYIWQNTQPTLGSRVKYYLALKTNMGEINIACEGEVVRVDVDDEDDPGKVGVGVKVLHKVGLGVKTLRQFGTQILLDQLKLQGDEVEFACA